MNLLNLWKNKHLNSADLIDENSVNALLLSTNANHYFTLPI